MSTALERFDLKNEIAVITGGAGLLGKKHAEAVLEGGGRVVLIDISKAALDAAVKDLAGNWSKRVWGYVVDITNEAQVEAVVAQIQKEVGVIGILINNAANNPKMESGTKNFSRLENFPRAVWDQDIAVGLTGAFLMAKYIGAQMAKRGKGVIVNIASDLGVIAPDQRIYRQEEVAEDQQPVKPITYSVVKHGLIGLSKYLATYWPDQGVRSNVVAFGGVANSQPEDFVVKLSNLIPLGRMANADEYKSAILFLCSDASSYMTGATLILDGGRTCW